MKAVNAFENKPTIRFQLIIKSHIELFFAWTILRQVASRLSRVLMSCSCVHGRCSTEYTELPVLYQDVDLLNQNGMLNSYLPLDDATARHSTVRARERIPRICSLGSCNNCFLTTDTSCEGV
jgi:hypothetical protein